MAKSREIIKRRKSVGNIRKITKTMEMIATVKFKRTYDHAMNSRVYHNELCGLFRRLRGDELLDHPLLQEKSDHDRALLFVITSNRGYCGGYNGNILRLAAQTQEQLKGQHKEVVIHVSGKKGIQYFKFVGKTIDAGYTQYDDKTRFEEASSLADRLMELYANGAVGSVRVVSMHFETGSRYRPKVLNLLPVADETDDESDDGVTLSSYLAEPSVEEIADELVPMVVRAKLYRCFLDAAVTEQVARMAAMKAATDNADKMLKMLRQKYNRARQTQITNELLDIMGGVEALK
ncbi:MAG: ATP synthase F1 subunit gamma [Planctomycetes bacterium]|nr:ATP synthase F1 subunit gamma [Planctomycetota bacterium]